MTRSLAMVLCTCLLVLGVGGGRIVSDHASQHASGRKSREPSSVMPGTLDLGLMRTHRGQPVGHDENQNVELTSQGSVEDWSAAGGSSGLMRDMRSGSLLETNKTAAILTEGTTGNQALSSGGYCCMHLFTSVETRPCRDANELDAVIWVTKETAKTVGKSPTCNEHAPLCPFARYCEAKGGAAGDGLCIVKDGKVAYHPGATMHRHTNKNDCPDYQISECSADHCGKEGTDHNLHTTTASPEEE